MREQIIDKYNKRIGEEFEREFEGGTYHIHIDAAILPKAFEAYLKQRHNFYDDDFDHELHITGMETPAPARHLTLKLPQGSQKDFFDVCKDISTVADEMGLVGYIEGESIGKEVQFNSTNEKYNDKELPFRLTRRKLDPNDGESFKQMELHVEIDKRESDKGLVQKLAEVGMLVVHWDSETSDESTVIYTAAGDASVIKPLYNYLESYLSSCGGVSKGSLLLEAMSYHSLHGVDQSELPDVVDRIIWK